MTVYASFSTPQSIHRSLTIVATFGLGLRAPEYFIQNIFMLILILNAVNILSLLTSPNLVEARLASCGTMVLSTERENDRQIASCRDWGR